MVYLRKIWKSTLDSVNKTHDGMRSYRPGKTYYAQKAHCS